MTDIKYELTDSVVFDQGDKPWHKKGEGKVTKVSHSPVCVWYTLTMPDGIMVEVLQEDIHGPSGK